MKRLLLLLLFAVGLIGLGRMASADATAQKQMAPEELIKRFTAKESELREIWKEYAYQQESKVEVLGPANTVSLDYYQVSEFVFNDAGQRNQRILKAPPSSLEQSGIFTQEDKNALINLQPFALASEELPNYNVSYVGKEKVDDLNTYVFDVTPKVMTNERELKRMKDREQEGKFFQGRIWVDDEDLQIVKTAGKVVPEFKQRFPRFETYRENIDGRYWLPTYTFGDDKLDFPNAPPMHVRMVVKYKNYRRFQSDVKITGVEEALDESVKPEEKPRANAPNSGAAQTAPKSDAKKEDPKKNEETKPPVRQRPRP